MRRILALLVVAAVPALSGSAASAKPTHTLFGIVGADGAVQLSALNADTLAPYGIRVRLRTAGGWSFSPDKNHLAIATGVPPAGAAAQPVALRIIDLRSMRRIINVRIAADPRLSTGRIDPVVAVAWLGETRVVVLRQLANRDLEVVVVDLDTRRVVRRARLEGAVLDSARTSRELVLLLGEVDKIAQPRLVVVNAAGDQSSVVLTRIRAGWTTIADGESDTDSVFQTVDPALAVDAGARTAYVVTPDGVVATVMLDRLEASYRSLRGRYAKLANGATRNAVLVRPGLLAVAGTTYSVGTNRAGERTTVAEPTGVEFVDTVEWETTTLQPGATWVGRWGESIVFTGAESTTEDSTGIGFGVIGSDGRLRFRVLDGHAVHVVGMFLGRAYVYISRSGERAVIDLATGAVRGRRLGIYPWLLVDSRDGS